MVYAPPEVHDDALMYLSAAIDDSTTTIPVTALVGITTGSTRCFLTITKKATYGNDPRGVPEQKEQVLLTSVSTLDITATRNVDGKGALAFEAGDTVEVRNVREVIQELQNAITDGTDDLNVGALTFNGDFVGGAGSVDKTWSTYLDATLGLPETSEGATGPTSVEMRSQRVQVNVLDYVNAATKRATFRCALPPDYDGSALDFTVFWTATSGTSGDVLWRLTPIVKDDDETLDEDNVGSFGDVLDTFFALKDLHHGTVSITPFSAATGRFMHFTVIRIGGDVSDTFDDTARLIGVQVSY